MSSSSSLSMSSSSFIIIMIIIIIITIIIAQFGPESLNAHECAKMSLFKSKRLKELTADIVVPVIGLAPWLLKDEIFQSFGCNWMILFKYSPHQQLRLCQSMGFIPYQMLLEQMQRQKGLEKTHVKLGHSTQAKAAIGKSKQKSKCKKETNRNKLRKNNKRCPFCCFCVRFCFQKNTQKMREKQCQQTPCSLHFPLHLFCFFNLFFLCFAKI